MVGGLRRRMRGYALVVYLLSTLGGILPDIPHLWGGRHFPQETAILGLGLFWCCVGYALLVRSRAMGMVKE